MQRKKWHNLLDIINANETLVSFDDPFSIIVTTQDIFKPFGDEEVIAVRLWYLIWNA